MLATSLGSRLHVMEERLERKDVGYDVLPPLEAKGQNRSRTGFGSCLLLLFFWGRGGGGGWKKGGVRKEWLGPSLHLGTHAVHEATASAIWLPFSALRVHLLQLMLAGPLQPLDLMFLLEVSWCQNSRGNPCSIAALDLCQVFTGVSSQPMHVYDTKI